MNQRLPLSFLLLTGISLMLLLGLPSLLLLARVFDSSFLNAIQSSTVFEALRLSLLTTSISTLIIFFFGLPVAYLLARYDFWGRRLLDTLLAIPLVLPPVVAGVGLLLVFGRRGIVGSWLNDLGINIAFTSVAVILAQVFVASPLFIRTMKAGFQRVRGSLEASALVLGANPWRTFWRITLPLSGAALVEGLVLSWARALGEFGATLVFAGSLQGRTQTMPLAIYASLENDLDAALSLAAVLTVTAFMVLLLFRYGLPREFGEK